MKGSTTRPPAHATASKRKQSLTDPSVPNKRTQMRIPLKIPVKVTLDHTHETISTTCQDISWGGVAFNVLGPLPEEAKSVLIAFPWTRGKSLLINATILRKTRLENGQYLVATRFSCLIPENEAKLVKLLRMLITKDATADRSEPTSLFMSLNLIVSDFDEFRSMLAQMVTGTYTLLSFNAYELDQSVGLLVEGPDDLPPFSLRGRVTEVQQARSGEADWTGLYQLTLALEHPKAALRQLVDALPRRFSVASEASPVVGSSNAADIG